MVLLVEQLDSYCGIYCGGCFIRKSFRKNNRKYIPEKWNWITEDIPLECNGCKSDTLFIGCQHCKIRKCASERKIEFCNLCQDYVECVLIKNLNSHEHPHHIVAKHSLELIKQISKEKWLEAQQDRWKCKNCGYPYSWYEEKCEKCGDTLYNSRVEAKSLQK